VSALLVFAGGFLAGMCVLIVASVMVAAGRADHRGGLLPDEAFRRAGARR
jgi:hypothetical protein